MITKSIDLNLTHMQEIISYVKKHYPFEACGLLAGKNGHVGKVFYIKNVAQSPFRFVMDPEEQLKAFNLIEENKLNLLAIFHSHPSGPETLSDTDIAEATYDVIHVICSPRNSQWVARGFRIVDGTTKEVTINILE